jgi:putative transcriptional regulator
MDTKKEKVTKENFEDLLLKSVSEASEYVSGERSLTERWVSLIEEPPIYSKSKIKKIRSEIGISQSAFAKIFGESTSAVQHWEQGKRNMSKSASRLLNLIEKDHETVFSLITGESEKKEAS